MKQHSIEPHVASAGQPVAWPDASAPEGAGGREVSILYLLGTLLRRRYELIGWIVGTATVVVLLTLLTFDASYTSRTTFLPQATSSGAMSGLQAVAGRLGINFTGETTSESPEFYVSLLQSREILRPLLSDTFTVTESGFGEGARRSGTLLELLELEGDTPAMLQANGIRWLRENAIAASSATETGIVQLTVTTPWPRVSAGVAEHMLELVNEFNLRTRQSRAAAERRFTSTRLEDAQTDLHQAEGALESFLESNRVIENSPQLRFERDRLQRQVNLRQQIVTDLTQAYESARIAEVRNTPVITVIEPPEVPVRRNPRGLILRGLLGLALGVFLGTIAVFLRDAMSRSRNGGDADYVRLRDAWRETAADLRGISGRIRSRTARSS